MQALAALVSSLHVPLVRLRLVVLLYLAQLPFAWLIARPYAHVLERDLGNSHAGLAWASSFDESALADFERVQAPSLEVVWSGATPASLLYLAISFTLLSAGTFWILADSKRRSTPSEFLAGAGRYFLPYCRFLVIFVAGLYGLFWVNRGLTGFCNWFLIDFSERAAGSSTIGFVLHSKTVVMLVLLGVWIVASGHAKARAVVLGERNSIASFVRGLRTALSNPLGTPLLAVVAPLLSALLLAGYAVARDRVPVRDLYPGGDFIVPYWLELAVMTQLLVLLLHGVMVFWCSAFVRFQQAQAPVQVAEAPAPFEPKPLTVVDVADFEDPSTGEINPEKPS